VWHAHPDHRTCAFWIGDARSVHDVTVSLDRQPQCRCTRVPRTASWEQLGFAAIRPPAVDPSGAELFARRPAGPARDPRPDALPPVPRGRARRATSVRLRYNPRWAAAGGRRTEASCRPRGARRAGPSSPHPPLTPGRPPTRACDSCSRALLVIDVEPLSGSFRPLDGRPDKRGGPRPGAARIPRAGDDEVGAGWKRKTTGPQLKSYSTSVKLSNREPTIARANRSSLVRPPPELRESSSATPARRGAPRIAVRAGAGPGGAALERVGVVVARSALPRSRTSTRSRAPAPGA
jgi:hypothetical protein